MKHILFVTIIAALAACAPEPQETTPTGEAPAAPTATRAVIETSLGPVTVALHGDAAPVTTANFLAHARAGHYDGGAFYRAVREDNDREGVAPMSLIQGGHSFDGLDGAQGITHESTADTGLSHTRGAVSMGRNAPGTATTEFFIMVADYPGLDAGPDTRNPDEAGYAVFGEVVEGMDVVEAIWGRETSIDRAPEDFQYPQFLLEPVQIETVRVE